MQASHVHTVLSNACVSVLGMPRCRFALPCGLRDQARPKQEKINDQIPISLYKNQIPISHYKNQFRQKKATES